MKPASQLHEINHYQDQDFPVNVYYSDIHSMQPPGRWLRDFHWHDELQFTLVLSGSLIMQIDNLSISAQAGDIIFINTSLIHAVTQMSDDGSYASLNFPYRLLAFFPGSRMDQDYVLPYTAGGKFSAFSISPECAWQKELIQLHRKITNLFLTGQVKGNEYSICIDIVSMWNLLISNFHSHAQSVPVNLLQQQRLQSILLFIYEHYADDLQLSDLAGTANISVGECCRIFQNILHTTPYGYLTNYRIQTSVSLLNRDLPISQIAGLVGYNQVSNYIATFKRIIGCTPAQYRKQYLSASSIQNNSQK